MNTPESDGFIDYSRKVQCIISSKYPIRSIHNKAPITSNLPVIKNDFPEFLGMSNRIKPKNHAQWRTKPTLLITTFMMTHWTVKCLYGHALSANTKWSHLSTSTKHIILLGYIQRYSVFYVNLHNTQMCLVRCLRDTTENCSRTFLSPTSREELRRFTLVFLIFVGWSETKSTWWGAGLPRSL
jgi:hypothetical protein